MFKLATLIAVVAIAWFGCGGDYDATDTETIDVTVEMSAMINLESSSADSSTDASIFSEPKAIETANSMCAFSVFGSTLTSGGASMGNIGLTSSGTSLAAAKALCSNISNCIWCYPAASGNTCNIACGGAIAVNTDTPGDYFDITFLATHDFTTEMEADGTGMIRIDGDPVNFGDEADDLTYVSQDFVQTNCSDAANVVVEDESNTTLTGLTVDGDAYDATSADGVYHEYYEITTSAASAGNPKGCTVKDQVVVRCTVPAGLTGATIMDCRTSAIWKNSASFCQNQVTCAQFVY
jgi:hypothetical protein